MTIVNNLGPFELFAAAFKDPRLVLSGGTFTVSDLDSAGKFSDRITGGTTLQSGAIYTTGSAAAAVPGQYESVDSGYRQAHSDPGACPHGLSKEYSIFSVEFQVPADITIIEIHVLSATEEP